MLITRWTPRSRSPTRTALPTLRLGAPTQPRAPSASSVEGLSAAWVKSAATARDRGQAHALPRAPAEVAAAAGSRSAAMGRRIARLPMPASSRGQRATTSSAFTLPAAPPPPVAAKSSATTRSTVPRHRRIAAHSTLGGPPAAAPRARDSRRRQAIARAPVGHSSWNTRARFCRNAATSSWKSRLSIRDLPTPTISPDPTIPSALAV